MLRQELCISRASARQRKGRAGRVADGTLYRMYSQEDHDEQFEEFTKPEMQRAPLQELVLQVRNWYWNYALQTAV